MKKFWSSPRNRFILINLIMIVLIISGFLLNSFLNKRLHIDDNNQNSSTNSQKSIQEVAESRKKLFDEIKWSIDCENTWSKLNTSVAEVKQYEISQNKFIVEVPCDMTFSQGPVLSYFYYDKSSNPSITKQLTLDQYQKDESGKLVLNSKNTINTLTAEFNKADLSLNIGYRNTGLDFWCEYSFAYKFDLNKKDFVLTLQTHADACDFDVSGNSQNTGNFVVDYKE